MRCFLNEFWVQFSFDINKDLLFNLNNNIAINGLSLVNRLIFVELQDDGDLRLVGHRQDEALCYISILYVVVESHSVKS